MGSLRLKFGCFEFCAVGLNTHGDGTWGHIGWCLVETGGILGIAHRGCSAGMFGVEMDLPDLRQRQLLAGGEIENGER